jgi:hypothetical protein
MQVLRRVGQALSRRPVLLLLLLIHPIVSMAHIIDHHGAWQADGLPVGWDFAVFLTGARIVELDASRLYDFHFQSLVEHAWRAGTYHTFPFISPPFVALLFVPLAHIPYVYSLAVWTFSGVVVASVAHGWLITAVSWRERALLFCFFPFTFALIAGQSTLFVFAVMAGVHHLVKRERLALAGAACAMLTFKPQCLLGLFLFFLVRLRGRKALGFWASFAGVSLTLLGIGYAVSPAATRIYAHLAIDVLPRFQLDAFDRTQIHTWRSFWMLALPTHERLAEIVAALFVLGGAAFAIWFWRRRGGRLFVDYSLAVLLGLWCAPHAYLYDWTVLAIPLILALAHAPQRRPELLALFAIVAFVLLASELVAEWARAHFVVSVQPSLVLLAVLPFALWRVAMTADRASA